VRKGGGESMEGGKSIRMRMGSDQKGSVAGSSGKLTLTALSLLD